jgi:cell division protein FtsB
MKELIKNFVKKHYKEFIFNRYFITAFGFFIWILFFDKNDLISQYKMRSELRKLKREKEFFLKEIERDSKNLWELHTNPQTLEKFAREKYLMKKDNEDIFYIVEK